MPETPGALFVVATPIGNLGDVTLRAIETLKAADRVAAEDTRRTRQLLSHLGIAGKALVRFDEHAGEAAVSSLVAAIESGEKVALVTDAGTPVVSDPGAALVRAAASRGLRVVPVPGPSAALCAASASGLISGPFRFVGFLERRGMERKEMLAEIAKDRDPVILFESPRRVEETLTDLAALCPTREAVIARELTKVHEELVRGTLKHLAELAGTRAWLGEITLVLGEAKGEREAPSTESLDARIDEELEAGRRVKEIAEFLALETGLPSRDLYARTLARKGRR